MTRVTFNLTDESKLTAILEWLQKQPMVFDIRTAPKKLTRKQLKMRDDLAEALAWAEKHSRGEVKGGKDTYQLMAELEVLSQKHHDQ